MDELEDLYFDTGASITVLPRRICQKLKIERFIEDKLTGISPEETCKIPVKIFNTKARLEDPYGNITKEFEIWIACSERDDTSPLLGIRNILDQFETETNPIKGELILRAI